MDFLKNPMGLPYSAKMIHGMDGAQETQNRLMNNETFMMWQLRLYELAMSVFEWVNLPSGINSRQIEWWLLRDGVAVFLQDEALAEDPLQRSPEGYAIMQVLLQGGYDIYNLPVNRVAYAVEGWNIPLTSQNSVLIFNNNFRYPTWMVLNLYAMRLAEIDRTIDTNVIGQKMPKFVKCNEPQRLTFKNIAAKIMGNVPFINIDKNIDLTGLDSVDVSAPFVSDKLMALKSQYWNEALTYLGVNNADTKKERRITDELIADLGDVEAQRLTRLEARQLACKEINEMFGLEIDVRFRPSEIEQNEVDELEGGEEDEPVYNRA